MSEQRKRTITCPACGHLQDFIVRDTVDVTEGPNLKEALLSGALLRSVCARCGAESDVLYPLLYQDHTHRLLLWLLPGEGNPTERFPGLKQIDPAIAATHQLRIVRTGNALKEKVVIADAGLDDRVVELFKVLIRADPGTELQPADQVRFAGLEEEEGQAVLIFRVLRGDAQFEFTVPFEVFARFTEEAEAEAESLFTGSDPWLIVDEVTVQQRRHNPTSD